MIVSALDVMDLMVNERPRLIGSDFLDYMISSDTVYSSIKPLHVSNSFVSN